MKINTPAWVRDAVFYLIFPDRFAFSLDLAKPLYLEPWDVPPSTYGFKGGDFIGMAEHLDYLEDLGVNAIMLNPIFTSAANHRYHTINYFEVDPILGGNKAFFHFLKEAKRRKMRVVLDGVFNHTGRGFYQFVHTLENGIHSPYRDWFHFDVERLAAGRALSAFPAEPPNLPAHDDSLSLGAFGYKSWWNLPALPKLHTGSPQVREFIFEVARYWIEQGIDGWRLDVPSEINDDQFWHEFREVVKKANPEAYIVGEIWEDATRWLQGDQFDAVMNYLFTKAVLGFVGGNNLDLDLLHKMEGLRQVVPLCGASFKDSLEHILSMYDPAVTYSQLNLLDSHDTPRFITSVKNSEASLKLAALIMLTIPGAPCLYYGDEIGLGGGLDPHCRAAFPWNQRHWNQNILRSFKQLIELRKSSPALRYGAYQSLYGEGDIYAFRRHLSGAEFIIAVNRGASASDIGLELSGGRFAAYQEALSGATYRLDKNNCLNLNLPPQAGLALEGKAFIR